MHKDALLYVHGHDAVSVRVSEMTGYRMCSDEVSHQHGSENKTFKILMKKLKEIRKYRKFSLKYSI